MNNNYLIENQETIKKLILWLNKKIFRDNIEYMNHPNTPVTFNGNQFVAHS
jgi:hypothetical protein